MGQRVHTDREEKSRVKHLRPSEFELRFGRMMSEEMTRKRLLRRGAAGFLSVTAIAYLAACGNDGSKGLPGDEEAKVIPRGEISDRLEFSNWPLYIDVDEKTKKHPTLEKFRKKYGTQVDYVEEINDNLEFFDKVRQQYEQGRSGGRDLHVITDWMCNRMKKLGFVQKLDKSQMPNVVRNIAEAVASPDFD